jgi:hypothetical protein
MYCKTHSKGEHNAPTPTHKPIERHVNILTTEESNFLIKNILTPDDGHLGRNL